MDETLELVDKLADSVSKSEAYCSYIKALEKIKKDDNAFNTINEFKRKHIDYQKRAAADKDISFDEEIYMSRLYYNIIRNDDIKLYFESEQKFLNLMNAVYTKLGSSFSKIFESI